MTEQAPGAEPVCSFPDCERPSALERMPLEVCREHGDALNAAADVEYWTLALRVLRPWVATTHAIGFARLTRVFKRAMMEAEVEADLAQDELRRAERAAAL